MSDTSFSAEQLTGFVAALETALARGVLRTSINGEMVEFANEADLRKRIAYFRGELARMTTGTARGGLAVSYPVTSRGL
jgi:hypothetical protein